MALYNIPVLFILNAQRWEEMKDWRWFVSSLTPDSEKRQPLLLYIICLWTQLHDPNQIQLFLGFELKDSMPSKRITSSKPCCSIFRWMLFRLAGFWISSTRLSSVCNCLSLRWDSVGVCLGNCSMMTLNQLRTSTSTFKNWISGEVGVKLN